MLHVPEKITGYPNDVAPETAPVKNIGYCAKNIPDNSDSTFWLVLSSTLQDVLEFRYKVLCFVN